MRAIFSVVFEFVFQKTDLSTKVLAAIRLPGLYGSEAFDLVERFFFPRVQISL